MIRDSGFDRNLYDFIEWCISKVRFAKNFIVVLYWFKVKGRSRVKRWVYNTLDLYGNEYHFNWDVIEEKDVLHIKLNRPMGVVATGYSFHIPLKLLSKNTLTFGIMYALEQMKGYW